jgi:hypothetical protein
VHRDCLVHFEGRQYAVPFALVGRHVEVRGCARTVQIVAAHRVVIEYPRHSAARLLLDPRCYEGEARTVSREIQVAFIAQYNTEWIVERLGYRTPAQARRAALQEAA